MSRPKATLIRVSALVPFELESLQEDDTKNLRDEVYQAKASIIRAYSLVSLLEKGEKNDLTPVIWDSLTKPNFGNHPMGPGTRGTSCKHPLVCHPLQGLCYCAVSADRNASGESSQDTALTDMKTMGEL